MYHKWSYLIPLCLNAEGTVNRLVGGTFWFWSMIVLNPLITWIVIRRMSCFLLLAHKILFLMTIVGFILTCVSSKRQLSSSRLYSKFSGCGSAHTLITYWYLCLLVLASFAGETTTGFTSRFLTIDFTCSSWIQVRAWYRPRASPISISHIDEKWESRRIYKIKLTLSIANENSNHHWFLLREKWNFYVALSIYVSLATQGCKVLEPQQKFGF